MKTLDDELRDALRREQPPAGFAERVLSRVGDPEPKGAAEPRWFGAPPRWRVMRWAAAAVLVAAVAGGIEYRAMEQAREERAKGEAAKEQVIQALRIAGEKLQVVQETIKEIGS